MIEHLITALRVTTFSVVIFGLLYPVGMTGLAQLLFPKQANGSLVMRDRKIAASDTVGQLWTLPKYFHGRPSAAGKNGYDPTATGGTALGPSSKKLIDATAAVIAGLKKANPHAPGAPPMDLVTSSASGIDPDISPASAYWQAPRVASARHISLERVDALVATHVQSRELGFLGEPRVNVGELNRALDDGT